MGGYSSHERSQGPGSLYEGREAEGLGGARDQAIPPERKRCVVTLDPRGRLADDSAEEKRCGWGMRSGER